MMEIVIPALTAPCATFPRQAAQLASYARFPASTHQMVIIRSLRAIRHRDGFGAFDEHKGSVTDDRHTSRAGQSIPQNTDLRTIVFARQFGKTSLTFRLDQRLRSQGPQPSRYGVRSLVNDSEPSFLRSSLWC